MSRKFLLLLSGVTLACGDSPQANTTATVNDSAGVRIVMNPDGPLPVWSVDSVPISSIGSAGGEGGQDLALPWSSLRLSDGRIAISNGRSNELRLYSSAGELVQSVGGTGDGPGEFRMIAALKRLGSDSIIAADAIEPRLTVFSTAGEYGRTLSIEPLEVGLPRLRGILHDTLGVWAATIHERSGGVSRGVREQLLVALRPLAGGATTTIGQFPAAEKFNQVMPHGGIAGWNQPFSRDAFTAVTDSLVWIGHSDRYEIRGYDASGRLSTVIRVDRPLTTVGDAERSRYFEHQLAELDPDDPRNPYVQVHRIIAVPPTMPAFSAMIADADGNLWVKEYRVPWATGPAIWRIFAPNGEARAIAHLPDDLVVHEIGPEYILGMRRDELDVEYIQLYPLRRTAS